jgi:hypothetical protein
VCSFRREPHRAIEADRFAVEIALTEDERGELGEFFRLAEARRERIDADSDFCTSSGMPSTIGVQKMPGAIVLTRMPKRASSRAIGSVMPTTPPFDAEYAACPIWPS